MHQLHQIKKNNFGIVLLAAGSSSRLGRPKQLLEYNNQTLLQHNLEIAINSDANEIVVVLGAHLEGIKNKIDFTNIHLTYNSDWQEGMASSIRSGINMLTELNPTVEGVIIMVCDQPHTTSKLLNELLTTYLSSNKQIVSSAYENTLGPPVFFHRNMFPELLKLSGEMGAKKLITQYVGEVEIVNFPKGKIDIDTEFDYRQLLKD